MTKPSIKIPAVVIGSCHHALAICRSLGRMGVPTFVVHEKFNMPALKTKYAKSIYVSDINSEKLIPNLLKLSDQFLEKPVLFPTNDNMVIHIASNLESVKQRYRLNWPDADTIFNLVYKKNLPGIIKKAGLHYPSTYNLYGLESLYKIKDKIQYPVILKPSRPLSPFKVKRVNSEKALKNIIESFKDTVDCFILQELIPGSDRDIYFVNLYYSDKSDLIAQFTGRKIRANPKTLGAACSAEGVKKNEILNLAKRFFSSVDMKGPAALEFKKGIDGKFYVIEPTVGRTEFLLKTSIESGVDIPYIAYLHQAGCAKESLIQKNHIVWIDLEKDFPMFLDSLKRPEERKEIFNNLFKKKVFAYWAWDDPLPAIYNNFAIIKRLMKKILNRILPSFFWSMNRS